MRLAILFLLLIHFQAFAKKKKDINELDIGLHEPLFIDLVRPIASQKGNLEMNALCYGKNGKILCAPEIEYVISNGFAVEFEVPMEGIHAEALKFAVQKQINSHPFSKDYDHAIQVLTEKSLHNEPTYSALFYVSGYHNNNFSIVAMNGLSTASGVNSLVNNIALYHNHTQKLAYGIEYNFAAKGETKHRILPQIKYDMNCGLEVQLGVGTQNRKPLIAGRLIYVI